MSIEQFHGVEFAAIDFVVNKDDDKCFSLSNFVGANVDQLEASQNPWFAALKFPSPFPCFSVTSSNHHPWFLSMNPILVRRTSTMSSTCDVHLNCKGQFFLATIWLQTVSPIRTGDLPLRRSSAKHLRRFSAWLDSLVYPCDVVVGCGERMIVVLSAYSETPGSRENEL